MDRKLVGYSPWSHKRIRHDLATKLHHQLYHQSSAQSSFQFCELSQRVSFSFWSRIPSRTTSCHTSPVSRQCEMVPQYPPDSHVLDRAQSSHSAGCTSSLRPHFLGNDTRGMTLSSAQGTTPGRDGKYTLHWWCQSHSSGQAHPCQVSPPQTYHFTLVINQVILCQ